MIKLYKNHSGTVSYWEAWVDSDEVVIHWGNLGETGETRRIKTNRNQDPSGVIEKESRNPRSNGFEEIEPISELIIHYKCEGWGDSTALDKRYKVQELMNECLGWTGNGHCDGGDIGSGSINVYCFVIDRKLAAEAALESLKEASLLDGAIIASIADCESEDEEYLVHWPEKFHGKFLPI